MESPMNQCECEQERQKRQKTLNNLLRLSAKDGHIINVKKWVKAGAEIDTSDNEEGIIVDGNHIEKHEPKIFTPLQAALLIPQATRSHYDVVEFLLKKGANPNSEFKYKHPNGHMITFTPALQTIFTNNIAMLKLLLAYGADINYKNWHKQNLGLLYQALTLKSFEMVEFLVKNGIDLKKCTDTSGKTPLHHAIENGNNLKVIKLLLDNGADLRATTLKGETPMHSAAEGDNLKIVKFLFEQGVEINNNSNDNKEFSKQRSPLQIAVLKQNYEIVEFLLENGANVNQKSEYQGETKTHKGLAFATTALHLACRNGGHNNIAEILMKYGAEVDASEYCTSSDTPKNWTPLHLAASNGLHLIVRNMLKKGANFELKNSDGETPLQISVAKGYTHIVKLLHKKGAQINTTNYRRQTPLHQASEKGFQNIVEYLIQNGADLECQDGVGRTPLQCAVGAFRTADWKHLGTVECLITYGANVNAGIICQYPRPLEMAKIMKQQTEFSAKGRALEQLLLKYGAEFRKLTYSDRFEVMTKSLSKKELKRLNKLAIKDEDACMKEIDKKMEKTFLEVHFKSEEFPQLPRDGAEEDMFLEMLKKFKRI